MGVKIKNWRAKDRKRRKKDGRPWHGLNIDAMKGWQLKRKEKREKRREKREQCRDAGTPGYRRVDGGTPGCRDTGMPPSDDGTPGYRRVMTGHRDAGMPPAGMPRLKLNEAGAVATDGKDIGDIAADVLHDEAFGCKEVKDILEWVFLGTEWWVGGTEGAKLGDANPVGG